MIIVAGTIDVDPADRDAFLAGRVGVMRRSRGEEGCHHYSFTPDPLDEGRVVLFERWESQEALDAHVAVLRADPRPGPDDVKPRTQSIAVYEVASARSLGG